MAGSVSATVTFAAVPGPLLRTLSVYVTVSPGTRSVRSALFVIVTDGRWSVVTIVSDVDDVWALAIDTLFASVLDAPVKGADTVAVIASVPLWPAVTCPLVTVSDECTS